MRKRDYATLKEGDAVEFKGTSGATYRGVFHGFVDGNRCLVLSNALVSLQVRHYTEIQPVRKTKPCSGHP